jgi:redox-sensitive bicupin YhaK (pirin superfamily)
MTNPVLQQFPLGQQWPTIDPFLFVAHHNDSFPPGNDQLGPMASLEGRSLGQDFSGADGWSMYHGVIVPGFPQHPHRGFETVSYVRRGLIDHADSLGATARFGQGDIQWMTAGGGVQHSEMFPLLDADQQNPMELFQIWLNLPPSDKLVDPYFTMLWSEDTPRYLSTDAAGRSVEVTVIAGALDDCTPPVPPPNSWAARADADVAIWHIRMAPDARWTLPAAQGAATMRSLYAFEGSTIEIDATELLDAGTGAVIAADVDLSLVAGSGGIDCMLLQGRPIGEPVAQYGPFVMNTEAEVRQAMADYRETQFGGWPWATPAPDHGATKGRFAIHADGRREDRD